MALQRDKWLTHSLARRPCAAARIHAGPAVITCSASSYDRAEWPTFAPYGVSQYVNGTCDAGYQATDPARPPQRYCLAIGTYTTDELNACIRASGAGAQAQAQARTRAVSLACD